MYSLKELRVTKLWCISICALWIFCNSLPSYAQDQTDWWFDVEVLIFKHNDASQTVIEQFDDVVDKPYSENINNLFHRFHFTDISWLEQSLPECEPFSMTIGCRYPLTLEALLEKNKPVDPFQYIQALPIHYNGHITYRSESAHILPRSELKLTRLYHDINLDKSYTPLLHTIWRQPVAVGQENAFSVPLLAGENLSPLASTLLDDSQVPIVADTNTPLDAKQARLLPTIMAQLNLLKTNTGLLAPEQMDSPIYPDQLVQVQDQAIIDTESVFELEGLLTIFIKYINRVPYLHIDSHALFHSAIEEDGLLTIKPHTFKQRRRIISNQVHYFDHPYFGMVIILKRHKRPAPLEEYIDENLHSNR